MINVIQQLTDVKIPSGLNITEHTCSENLLIDAESKNTAIKQFLVSKNHEIRTLMTRIIGMTELTLMTELTEEQLKYLTILKASTGLLIEVFINMQDYAKLPTDRVIREQGPFNIRATIQEVVDLFDTAAKQKNVDVRLRSIDNVIPENLIGDRVRFKQVLSILIGNGVKFTNNAEVTLVVGLKELTESTIKLEFIVSDLGSGISEDKLSELFKLFSKTDNSDTTKFVGTGLSISKNLVELMGGDIQVESTEGVGSKFSFTLVFRVQGMM